jgi:hypothetical protein
MALSPTDPIVRVGPTLSINEATYLHWVGIAHRSGGHATEKQVRSEVLQYLISAEWLLGEAGADHVVVSASAIAREFRSERRQQFPTLAAYRRFLRHSGQTEQDILFKVRLNLTSQAVQAHATAGLKGAAAAHALARFLAGYRARWQAQTTCRSPFVISLCAGTFT